MVLYLKRIRCKSFLFLSVVIALTTTFTACDGGVSGETYEYLDNLQTWTEDCDNNFRPYTDPSWDLLLDELISMKPPAESIPVTNNAKEQIYLLTAHERLIRVFAHVLSAGRHEARMREIEQSRLSLEGRDYLPPACDLCGQEPLSEQYCQACRLREEAVGSFIREETVWQFVFNSYLPDR